MERLGGYQSVQYYVRPRDRFRSVEGSKEYQMSKETWDLEKTLRRMRLHHILLTNERDAHKEMHELAARLASDLEEAIKTLEKEIEG